MKRFGVYADKGADPFTLACLFEALTECPGGRWDIVPVQAEQIGSEGILETLDVFAMPGGPDRSYCESLNGAGTAALRAFVEEGGRYLGICGGAYFACAGLDFSGKVPGVIRERRELALFPGQAVGPLTELAAPFDDTYRSAAIVGLDMACGGEGNSFYMGGPFFAPAPEYGSYEPLAFYSGVEAVRSLAAIFQPVGEGGAVLCGAHPEVRAVHLEKRRGDLRAENAFRNSDEAAYFDALLEQLQRQESGRSVLWKKLLDRLLG